MSRRERSSRPANVLTAALVCDATIQWQDGGNVSSTAPRGFASDPQSRPAAGKHSRSKPMERVAFNEEEIKFLREHYGKIKTVNPDTFHKRMDRILKDMNNDTVSQVIRADIKWLSREARGEARRRGIKID